MKPLTEFETYPIPVDIIDVDPTFNCRGNFTLMSVTELAESITEIGLQCPVTVQPHEDRYRLLAGHRRYKAVTEILKWSVIPATIRNVAEHSARLLNLTENLERRNLSVLEEAKAIHAMYADCSIRQIATELNRPTKWVGMRLQLLDVPTEVQQWFAAGMIAVSHIPEVAAADDPVQAARSLIYHAKVRKPWATSNRRTKEEIAAMIRQAWDLGHDGLVTRALAWAAGHISDEDLLADLTGAQ